MPSRIEDLPAPFGPIMRFSPGSNGTLAFVYDMKLVSWTSRISGCGFLVFS